MQDSFGLPFINSGKRQSMVLLVDDQPGILRFMEIMLKTYNFQVIPATSGKQALELAEAKCPDIMLLDIVMPGMNGLDVLSRLRTFSQMPVIVFSASSEYRDSAMQLGAKYFVSKPFDPEDMVRKIGTLVSNPRL